jgi:hypothetical protein
MIIQAVILFAFISLSNLQLSVAYDDQVTHPALTELSVQQSVLKNYLSQNLGFSQDYDSVISGQKIIRWIMGGSTAEDHAMCRAANHFHNPLLPWGQSYMSDDTSGLAYVIRQACSSAGWSFSDRRSAITWATGFLAPPPAGAKASFNTGSLYKPINWDEARRSYYDALTATNSSARDSAFADTFKAVGQVLHLIQDMAVPAHVRNDFQSHLIPTSLLPWDMLSISNYYNRYEHYVSGNTGLIQAAQPPQFGNNIRLTDFWDTDTYNGTNPSYNLTQGLAEFTNANFFSEFTIPFSQIIPVTSEHTFPHPAADYYGNAYTLCNDTNENGHIVKYLSRTTCPTLGSGQVDHFLTVSLINVPGGGQTTHFWTDNKVHSQYAQELLPRAVGYSAAILDYFFRGTIEIRLPDEGIYSITDTDGDFTKIKLKARNSTASGE